MGVTFYRSIVETASEGVVVVGEDSRVKFANKRAAELLGYHPGEGIGLAASDFVVADDQAARDELRDRLRRGESERSELRLLRKDGVVLWVSIRSAPLFDEAGGYAGGLLLFDDIGDRKRAEAAIQESEARFRGIFEHAAVGVLLVGLDYKLIEMNPAFCAMLDCEAGDLIGRSVREISHPDDWASYAAESERLVAGEIDYEEMDKRYLHRDGHFVYAHTSVSVIRDSLGAPRYLTSICQDVSARVEALDELHRSEELLRMVVNSAPDLIFRYRFDPDPGFEYVSPALERLYGYSLAEFPSGPNPLRSIMSDEDADIVLASARSGSDIPVLARVRHKDGREIWSEAHVNMVYDAAGHEVAMEGIVRDVSERKALEDQLMYQSLHDSLTGLGNRAWIRDRIAQALASLGESGQSGGLVALLYLDLDQFKVVNDMLGHTSGDELLKAVAGRIVFAARKDDSVARLGGDEFVILCAGLAGEEQAIEIARRVKEQVALPFSIANRELSITASIGIAMSPVGSLDDLIHNADAAMYSAKRLDRSHIEVFSTA